MYVRLNEDGTVKNYPYTLTDLRFDCPNVSFPIDIPADELAAYGVYSVVPRTPPTVDYTKNLSDSVEFLAGVWVQLWVVTEASDEEKSKRLANAWSMVRAQRDYLLSGSDWTQLSDVPLSDAQRDAWKTYRSDLRNITNQPDPFNIVWPPVPA